MMFVLKQIKRACPFCGSFGLEGGEDGEISKCKICGELVFPVYKIVDGYSKGDTDSILRASALSWKMKRRGGE